MSILDGFILGVVQGITEFLPISSSGHLILIRDVLGAATSYDLAVDALLHFATAAAVFIYFRRDFWAAFIGLCHITFRKPVEERSRSLLLALMLGTIPAVVFGLLLEDSMETIFRSAELVAGTLIAGSIIFFIAEKVAKKNTTLTPRNGLAIGFFQALALLPGMSRSGMTISGGLFLGLSREEAARFGFMLGFPVMFGAGLKKILELGSAGVLADAGTVILVSMTAAFITGFLAIHYLLKYLKNHSLHIFIWYRVLLAILVLALL